MVADFIRSGEPPGNQIFCQWNECIPEVVKARCACIKEVRESALFSANFTADDPTEMISGKYVLSQLGDDGAYGPYDRREWEGIIRTTSIFSSGMNAAFACFLRDLGSF